MSFLKCYRLIAITILLGLTTFSHASQSWKFKVYLDDQEIGVHTFEVATYDNQQHVKVNAKFDVYFLFINAYSYEHQNHEIWNNQCLQSVRSTTNDNGEQLYVNAEFEGQRLNIKTASGKYSVEGCIQTFAYWDPDFLKSQQLLNAQTGELMPVKIEKIAEENIIVRGRLTPTRQYRVTSEKFTIDLWYSNNNEWLALNSTTSSGATLKYKIQ